MANELKVSVEKICELLSREPNEFEDVDHRAILVLLAQIEPEIRRRNLNSDFDLTRDLVAAIKPGSRPRRATLERAFRAAYGLKMSVLVSGGLTD